MKRYRWSIMLGISLLATSILTYFVQIDIFHDPRDTFFYMLQDFAFVPIQVLLVTLFLNELLAHRSKQELRAKMNMVIGAFYSDMGTALLRQFIRFDTSIDQVRALVAVENNWSEANFTQAQQQVRAHRFAIAQDVQLLTELKGLLATHQPFLLGLLENPNLLEHESFTDLLWAVSHLGEELAYRDSLVGLPETDYAHLAGDIQRAYKLLIIEWLAYVQHLRDDYPYIFSLVTRMNPFNPQATPVVR